MELIYACVLAAVVTLSEAKSSDESFASQLRNSQYPPPIHQQSEERYLPLLYGDHPIGGHYSLPLHYNPGLEDFPPPSYDHKFTKPHGYSKYKRKSTKQRLGPQNEHRSKKQYRWPKYEPEVKTHYMPRTFEQDLEGSKRSYRSQLFDYDSKTRYPPSPYYDHVYGHHQLPLRENVNIFITPSSKKHRKKVHPLVKSSEESYENSQSCRYPWGGECSPPSSYGRVYRSPVLGYAEGVQQSPHVEYDPSAETSLQLYRQALYGSPSWSSSHESAPSSGRRSHYPKRSPQHPEEFLASLTKFNDTSPASPQQQVRDAKGNGPVESTSSEDTLTYINRILATQRQSTTSHGSENGNKQEKTNSEYSQPDYSILGEGTIAGYSGGRYSTGGFHDSESDGDRGAPNETEKDTKSRDYSDSSASASS